MSYQEVLAAARSLSDDELDLLVTELSDRREPVLSDEWLAEIDRRAAEIDSGEAKTIPWDEARREARARFNLDG